MSQEFLNPFQRHTTPAELHCEGMPEGMKGEPGQAPGLDKARLHKPLLGHVLQRPLSYPAGFLGDEEGRMGLHRFPTGPLEGDEGFQDLGDMGIEKDLPCFTALRRLSPDHQMIPNNHPIEHVPHVEEPKLLDAEAGMKDEFDYRKVSGCGLGVAEGFE